MELAVGRLCPQNREEFFSADGIAVELAAVRGYDDIEAPVWQSTALRGSNIVICLVGEMRAKYADLPGNVVLLTTAWR